MQIILHWVIAALVVFDLVYSEIGRAYHEIGRGIQPSADALFSANIHVYVGIAVLVLAIWRFGLRLAHGVPELPADENPTLKTIAVVTHWLLYLIIFGMPVTGMLAWYFHIGIFGDIHQLGQPLVYIVVGVHAAGALWQHFIARTDVLMRMLVPGRRAG